MPRARWRESSYRHGEHRGWPDGSEAGNTALGREGATDADGEEEDEEQQEEKKEEEEEEEEEETVPMTRSRAGIPGLV